MTRQFSAEEVDAFMRQLKILIGGIVVVFVLPLVFYAWHLDRRLDDFEQSLKVSRPEELQTQDFVRDNLTQRAANPVEGQTVYVPAYSHVYHAAGKPYLLTITLSVRNTSLDSEIVVKSVRYFDTKGKEVKSYLVKPVKLPALGTTEVVVERDDATGGSGANFLVEWYANQPVTEPIIESVMIDTSSQQGISFARRGSVISHVAPQSASTTEDGK